MSINIKKNAAQKWQIKRKGNTRTVENYIKYITLYITCMACLNVNNKSDT